MQRKEYPGLYWDEDRQRYFPLSSKPKSPVDHASGITHRAITHRTAKHHPQRETVPGAPLRLQSYSDASIFRNLESLRSGANSFARRERITQYVATHRSNVPRRATDGRSDIVCRSIASACHHGANQINLWPHGPGDIMITDFRVRRTQSCVVCLHWLIRAIGRRSRQRPAPYRRGRRGLAVFALGEAGRRACLALRRRRGMGARVQYDDTGTSAQHSA